MNYQEALEYILRFADYERMPRSALVWDLRRIERLLDRLGNPQDAARSIHIAGTKGKGSTSAMIASILKQSGYKVGLYTSPHLFSFTERIQANGRPIPEDTFARLTASLEPEIEAENRLGDLGDLTTFEILTALAFIYYREIGVDFQVMETGLGGRLDATNVVRSEVSVITSISFDHMDVLGNTLAQIATEKAGIIKPGNTVVCAPQFSEAMKVIEQTCLERRVRLVRVGNDVTWRGVEFSSEGQSFHLKGLERAYDLHIPLIGEHQLENAATAVATVEVLELRGVKISPECFAEGLRQVYWPGRLQVLQRAPWVIVDGAHNAYSMKRLVEALKQYFQADRITLIIGVSSDKDVAGMVDEAKRLTNNVIISRSRNPRSLETSALANAFKKSGAVPQVTESVASAMKIALAGSNTSDLICVTGSIFVVAEAMEYMASLKSK